MNRPAPVGSALRAQQEKISSLVLLFLLLNLLDLLQHQWLVVGAPKPAANTAEDLFTGKPIPSAKPAGGATAVGSAAKPAPAGSAAAGSAGAAAAPVVKKKPAMGARNRMRMEELDIFDTIKEYLIDEGATEEEALKQMLTLTDEQRTEILEGSCGSKPKKKGGYKK